MKQPAQAKVNKDNTLVVNVLERKCLYQQVFL
jgi:hypothetical protein